MQETLDRDTAWYVDPDGGLDLAKLIRVLQDFFRRHSEHWKNRFEYEEAWPRILLQAFLHRVVNGGGRIECEYGLGRGRRRSPGIAPDAGSRIEREYGLGRGRVRRS